MVGPGSRVFGKYEVLRRIAVGGMGEIFLARQTGVVDRLVILKSLLPQLASDAQALAQFLDEARILGSINHPNVCALFDVGEWEGLYFIAMEYINGVDLAAILKFCEENKKRLPPLTSAHIVRDVALGLDAAHVATDATGQPLRVVHRDISPHNIMVRQDGLSKVVDFGVAMAENRMQKTEAGMLKGKLGYMPPEQIKGSPVDPKADQFSLGVVLWEMLTQRRLFTGENAAQVFMRILKEPVPPPSSLVPDIPKELDAVVQRMTANEPVERFARLADAGAAIRKVLEQYKSPENAAAILIRATVGAEISARLKELAQAPRPEAPTPQSATSSSTPRPMGSNPGSPGSPAGGAFCGSCGTQSQPGDRFCRVCGNSVGTGGSGANARAPGTASGSIPRVDVMVTGRTGVVDAPAQSQPGGAPVTGTPRSTGAPATELAVIGGLVEVLSQGQVVSAGADARKAAFDALDAEAATVGATVEKRADGRFTMVLQGDDAIARAVAFVRSSVRLAARVGQDVMFRMAVAAEPSGSTDKLPALQVASEILVDNSAPGSAVIVDGARQRGGNPATTRSAQVPLPTGTVTAWELVLPRRLVGRGAEVALIDGALEAVAAGSKAQQVMLLAEAGLGKTALLEVAEAFARDRGYITAFARGARVVAPLALDVLRQLIRLVGLEVTRRDGQQGGWVRALELLELPPVVVNRLRAIVDDRDDPSLQDIPANRRRSAVKAAVIAFFEKVAARAPVALFVDDHQQGDHQSFEFLAELGARLAEKRIFILVAGRPVPGVRVLPLAKRTMVGPLSAGDVVAVAGLLVGAPVIDPLAGLVVTRGNGNPLLVTVLLRHLAALGQLAMSPEGMRLQGAADRLNLPGSPTALLHANHALLPAEAQSVLLAAAHLGQIFATTELSKLIDGVKDLPAALKVLVEYGIIEALGPEMWLFRSTFELQTIPDRLDGNQQRTLQQRVSDALTREGTGTIRLDVGERLATHLQAAEARQKAAEVSVRVAERAMNLGLFELAADHFKRAMLQDSRSQAAEPGDEGKAARLLLDAAGATAALTEVEPAVAIDVLAPVLKAVPPLLAIAARVTALQKRGLAFSRTRRFSEAEGCFDEALETLQGEYDASIAASVLIDLASALEARGDADSAIAQVTEALRLLNEAPPERRTRAGEALLQLGRLRLRQRQLDGASQALGGAVEALRQGGRATLEAEARGLLGALLQAQGKMEEALVEVEAAIALAVTVGDPILEARLRQQLGRGLVGLGRRSDAAAALGLALEAARRGQWDEGITACQQLLAVVGS